MMSLSWAIAKVQSSIKQGDPIIMIWTRAGSTNNLNAIKKHQMRQQSALPLI